MRNYGYTFLGTLSTVMVAIMIFIIELCDIFSASIRIIDSVAFFFNVTVDSVIFYVHTVQ